MKKLPVLWTSACFLLFMSGTPISIKAQSAQQVSRHGITWTFDKAYEVGQFANGDYWVLGPVTITSIQPMPVFHHLSNGSPNTVCTGFTRGINACSNWCLDNAPTNSVPYCDGSDRGSGECHCSYIRNGWEVNPMPAGGQGFDSRASNPQSLLIPSLPFVAKPGDTLVNSISGGPESDAGFAKLKMAAALTVVGSVPPGGGVDYFRPPYVGKEKPLIPVSSLQVELLPSLSPVKSMPTLEALTQRFTPLQMDHKSGLAGRNLHPYEAMPNYGSDLALGIIDGAARLMMDDSLSAKRPLLIAYTQYGIDLLHIMKNGGKWGEGGGHRPGMKLPVSIAATLLNNSEYKNLVKNADHFHEDLGVFRGVNGVALYGFSQSSDFSNNEKNYWAVVMDYNAGYRSHPDPYGYIDGGHSPGTSYQGCCTSNLWKGEALALHLMPEIKTIWNNSVFFDYVDRWVEIGAWSQPDVCAPFDNNKANYKVTFGPDPSRPGDCIRDTNPADGIGRFPSLHGTQKDGGGKGRYSDYIDAMWQAYRGQANIPKTKIPSSPSSDSANSSEPKFLSFQSVFHPNKGALMILLENVPDGSTMTVYDRHGNEVKSLKVFNDQAQWDGKNVSDKLAAAGSYLLVLKSNDKTIKKKVVLVK